MAARPPPRAVCPAPARAAPAPPPRRHNRPKAGRGSHPRLERQHARVDCFRILRDSRQASRVKAEDTGMPGPDDEPCRISVMVAQKTLGRLLSGTADAAIRFDDLCQLLKSLDFEERVRGSHYLFRKSGVERED